MARTALRGLCELLFHPRSHRPAPCRRTTRLTDRRPSQVSELSADARGGGSVELMVRLGIAPTGRQNTAQQAPAKTELALGPRQRRVLRPVGAQDIGRKALPAEEPRSVRVTRALAPLQGADTRRSSHPGRRRSAASAPCPGLSSAALSGRSVGIRQVMRYRRVSVVIVRPGSPTAAGRRRTIWSLTCGSAVWWS